MKLYIKSSSKYSQFTDDSLVDIDNQITNYLGDDLILSQGWGEGIVYLFKINNHNVYRVFLDPEEMIFQCVAVAYMSDEVEHYDDAQDYKVARGNKENWFALFKHWIDECEADDPNFTKYLEA